MRGRRRERERRKKGVKAERAKEYQGGRRINKKGDGSGERERRYGSY